MFIKRPFAFAPIMVWSFFLGGLEVQAGAFAAIYACPLEAKPLAWEKSEVKKQFHMLSVVDYRPYYSHAKAWATQYMENQNQRFDAMLDETESSPLRVHAGLKAKDCWDKVWNEWGGAEQVLESPEVALRRSGMVYLVCLNDQKRLELRDKMRQSRLDFVKSLEHFQFGKDLEDPSALVWKRGLINITLLFPQAFSDLTSHYRSDQVALLHLCQLGYSIVRRDRVATVLSVATAVAGVGTLAATAPLLGGASLLTVVGVAEPWVLGLGLGFSTFGLGADIAWRSMHFSQIKSLFLISKLARKAKVFATVDGIAFQTLLAGIVRAPDLSSKHKRRLIREMKANYWFKNNAEKKYRLKDYSQLRLRTILSSVNFLLGVPASVMSFVAFERSLRFLNPALVLANPEFGGLFRVFQAEATQSIFANTLAVGNLILGGMLTGVDVLKIGGRNSVQNLASFRQLIRIISRAAVVH